MVYPTLRWEDLGVTDWTNNAMSAWSDDYSDVPKDAVLHGAIQIGTAMFHVYAISVTDNEEGCQLAVDEAYGFDLDHVQSMCDSRMIEAVSLPGHDGRYVVVLYPFAV